MAGSLFWPVLSCYRRCVTPCAQLPGGMEASQPFRHRHHRFAQRCLDRFASFPRRPGARLIPHAQTLVGRLSRQPDVTLPGAFAHAQGLMEQADPARLRDAAHGMHAARTDWQALRQARGVA